jgi:manganese efflux pump family protein
MRRPVVLLGVLPVGLLAAVLVAGCSSGPRAPYRATTGTCYAFSVQALDRHVTVTSVPRACAGLSHEQINLAVVRAVRAVAGPRSKVAGRRVAHRELAYLRYLIKAAPVPAPAPVAAQPAGPPSKLPLRLAALAAWAATALAGSWLIAGSLAHGGLRRHGPRIAGVPRGVIIGHLTLALAGLGLWIAFVVTGVPVLAWMAVGVILAIAGLGMATLAGGLPSITASAGSASPGPGGPASNTAASAAEASGALASGEPAGPGPAAAAQTALREVPVHVDRPVVPIAVHGALAATTLLLVVLAAVGAG